MAIDQARALADYINSPEISYDWQYVSIYLEDAGIAVPEGMDEDEIAAWLEGSEHSTDYEVWFDNNLSDLIERGEVDWEPPTPYNSAHTESGWFIHFSNRLFSEFTDGVNRYHLGNSGGQREGRTIRCPANLTADPDKVLWIHAWEVFATYGGEGVNEQMVYGGPKYGRHALLFKSNEAVVARHSGHEEEHALVLGCSEYDAVQLLNVLIATNEEWGWPTLSGTAVLKEGEVEFATLEGLIDLLESRSRPQSVSGLSGRRRSRWHPLAAPSRR